MTQFKNRVFGCVIVKSINSNYNADFSGQPRTLPNGVVYATDKALKYAIKNYIKAIHSSKLLYFKTMKSDFVPMSLDEAYNNAFPNSKDKENKVSVAKNLLNCLDIKLFGATFAKKGKNKEENVALSIHGPTQINHGVNIWKENNIFSEQIMSPFRNPDEKSEDKEATTLGRQSKLQEGHYLHHFSINPKNLSEIVKLADDESLNLQDADITILKDALQKGVTYYDSAAKAGSDNEFLLWVKLNESSKTVLPNFSTLVKLDKNSVGKIEIDLSDFTSVFEKNKDEIESVEIYYLPESVSIKGEPTEKTSKFDLTSGTKI
jgi:CRISPR-associated protein Csh2